jgi:serine protease Do
MGTGVVIDERGYVITNYHVIEGVKRIRVTMSDGSTGIATLVANDPKTDLAIIRIPMETPAPVIRIGTSNDLMAGETVIAVGNAYGYEHTVTKGIISALHRTVQVSDYQKYTDLIQTDASINPGNSGGPLLNIDGDMIGINVAVRVGAQGIGFAIPVDEALEVAAELLSIQNLSRVAHGIIGKTTEDGKHVTIERVVTDSPADKAGLEPGDVILSAGNRPTERRLDLARAILDRSVGEEVELKIERAGQPMDISLVLAEAQGLRHTASDQVWDTLGLKLTSISNSAFRTFRSRYRGGLKVIAVRGESPAAQQGIRRGDVLVGMHKWETISHDNVAYILNSAEFKATQPFKFYILRNGETLFGNMRVATAN